MQFLSCLYSSHPKDFQEYCLESSRFHVMVTASRFYTNLLLEDFVG